ncbi:hypothetical protein [Rugamonas sp.]|uniref:hypothetical protein n=1 Tax=Rugamonas sp. TaxID=1926287 RepID=UPI0025D8394C|nr:hypothetical protein [Rugamonas sp.]
MKKILSIGLGAAALALSASAMAADISVNIGEPGFYGRLDIGGYPRPEVINSTPVVIENARHAPAAPVYLRVPVEYQRHWADHCRQYGACGERVYFVQDRWYANQYAPHYRSLHMQHDERHDDRRDDHRDDHHDDHHDDRR